MCTKTSYIALGADLIHQGHLNVIKKAASLGKLTVGVLSDAACASYKQLPVLPFEQRVLVVEALKGVDKVVEQSTLDYSTVLRELKPDFVVHGDDWKMGVKAPIRQKVIDVLAEWSGQLVEIEYVNNLPWAVEAKRRELKNLPGFRAGQLRRLIAAKDIVRVCEAHNGLTALLVDSTFVAKNGCKRTFDACWASSLTQSTVRGMPDIELVDISTRISVVQEMFELTSKPFIYDADTGGLIEHFVFNVRLLERVGIAAVIIEDKVGLKKNSLFGTSANQQQDTIGNFCKKIKAGKASQIGGDFMIIARIESLILKQGQEDALTRAKAYIEAGADGIMIHSKETTPDEIFEFLDKYNKFEQRRPVVVVPSTYSCVTEQELIAHGVNVVIYANQLLRAAFPAMQRTLISILENERAKEADESLMGIKEIINLIPAHHESV